MFNSLFNISKSRLSEFLNLYSNLGDYGELDLYQRAVIFLKYKASMNEDKIGLTLDIPKVKVIEHLYSAKGRLKVSSIGQGA